MAMELSLALSMLIDSNGAQVIENEDLVDLLEESYGFSDTPGVKTLLSYLVEEAEMGRLARLCRYCNLYRNELLDFCEELNDLGFRHDLIQYVVNCMAMVLCGSDFHTVPAVEQRPLPILPYPEECLEMEKSDEAKLDNPDEHSTFRGIPIMGSPLEFARKLVELGYKDVTPSDDSEWWHDAEEADADSPAEKYRRVLEGRFAGFDDCQILISGSDEGDLVSHVCVVLVHGGLTHADLLGCYRKMKDLLSKKYGRPVEGDEDNIGFYELDETLMDMEEEYSSRPDLWQVCCGYRLGKGYIMLCIIKESLMISYSDSLNDRVSESRRDRRLMEDL